MKRFKYILRAFAAVILICLTGSIHAAAIPDGHPHDAPITMDSVTISFLTCSPGSEIWAQYGHTAIRVKDTSKSIDIAVNYGMFSLDQTYFIPRFVFGLTDYKMGIIPFPIFMEEYASDGRGVVEQVLDISNSDKTAIIKALEENCKPENVTYRYNFFYDNCTTRARDMIVNHLNGEVTYPEKRHINDSFRDMIHEWNSNFPWISTGEDMLLGLQADAHTSKGEQQFLPENMKIDFDSAQYNGHKLVKETRILLQPQTQVIENGFPLSPIDCSIILIIIAAVVYALEYRTKKIFWGWDLFWMLTCGIIGIIPFIMIFSQHPCVRFNILLFFFNPLPLFFMFRAIKRLIKHEKDNWWLIWEIMIIIGLIGSCFIQKVPLIVEIVAFILLFNCIIKTTKIFKLQENGK